MDAGENVIGRFDPSKRLWIGVCRRDVGADGCFELPHRAESASLEGSLGQQGEEALDLVEPGSRCGGKMHMPPGPLGEPVADQPGFVGAVIVHDDVDIEIRGHVSLDLVEEYADVIQIGARNMQNFSLLKRAGRARKPVLLKRGMSATLEEFLMAAEYIMSEGNYNVILCERGIRTFETATRNTFDVAAVPVLKTVSHLPVIVDPSHAAGVQMLVPILARAAVVVGADGLLVEVHPQPEKAASDGEQSLTFEQFDAMMADLDPYLSLRAAAEKACAVAGGLA